MDVTQMIDGYGQAARCNALCTPRVPSLPEIVPILVPSPGFD